MLQVYYFMKKERELIYEKPYIGFLVLGIFFLVAGAIVLYFDVESSGNGRLDNLATILLGLIFIGAGIYYKAKKVKAPKLSKKLEKEAARREKQVFWGSWIVIIVIALISLFYSTVPLGFTTRNTIIAIGIFLFTVVLSYIVIKVFEQLLPISLFLGK